MHMPFRHLIFSFVKKEEEMYLTQNALRYLPKRDQKMPIVEYRL